MLKCCICLHIANQDLVASVSCLNLFKTLYKQLLLPLASPLILAASVGPWTAWFPSVVNLTVEAVFLGTLGFTLLDLSQRTFQGQFLGKADSVDGNNPLAPPQP